jgi:hypothetical protein
MKFRSRLAPSRWPTQKMLHIEPAAQLSNKWPLPTIRLIKVTDLFDRLSREEPRVSVVGRVGDVEAAKHLDGGVLGESRIVDPVFGSGFVQVASLTAQIVAVDVTQRRLQDNICINQSI